MLERIFPRQIDNTYRGHWLAIGLFVVAMLLTAAQGASVMLMTRTTLSGADGISLDSLGATGVSLVISLTALQGLFMLILPVQSVVVLIRYRAMIPFMFLCLLILDVGHRVLLRLNPIIRLAPCPASHAYNCGVEHGAAHHIGYYVSLAILAITIIGLFLSLFEKSVSPARDKPI